MKRNNIPPLNALRIFDIAAKSHSLSEAAHELGLTHGAVSRQIKLLEDWLGQSLFIRDGQRLVATEYAKYYAAEISSAFDLIGDATIRFGKSPTAKVIRINAQTTLASRWLIPLLPKFYEQYPKIEIAIETSDTDTQLTQFGFDILIRRDSMNKLPWAHFRKISLFQEKLTLIASPELLKSNPLISLNDLEKHIIISSKTRNGEWENWLEKAGVKELTPLHYQRFDHFHICLQAVIDGLGVCIGGMPTLTNALNKGLIDIPLPINIPGSHYSMWIPPNAERPIELEIVLDWLQAEAQSSNHLK
ncbi:LysR substrate-binding domain-containing protein [Providencia rustigianii]|uniref:LysR substrate-binding domain-containing protein n=1 Tax=Providencia rustigianii TaxID=158850 RepID=UPI00223EFD83|nr:LysR substrate-binding domain-containing protein [Providencia rustigianii]